MTEQPELNFLARTDDPETSKQAAREIMLSLGYVQKRAWDAVAKWPGCTCNELASYAKHRDNRTIGRRLGELEELGMVRRLPARECKITRRQAATWEVA